MCLDATRKRRSDARQTGQKRFSAETAGIKYLKFADGGGISYLRVNARKSASTLFLFVGLIIDSALKALLDKGL
jgi:hypothetical protein